ncbi:MAG: AarF/ABC1/UbiB kinase family protein [Polyangiaceae bacterium]|nr:AarF/ABC1/UbiB kinase family protein [Polyangiaceae bacterium]
MRVLSLISRSLAILGVAALVFVPWALRRLALVGAPLERQQALFGEHLARLLERLGATFIKFGQILSTRPDLISAPVLLALARLQDEVPPAPFGEVSAMLDRELGQRRHRLATLGETAVAAASVAQVHRGVLDDGREVAVKVQRPRAAGQIDRDLAILGFGARLVDRLPSVSLLSLPGAVERFGEALRGQLDFRREAANNRRFAANFASVPEVSVPTLVDELCTERVLVMEFVHGVKATNPEQVGGDRKKLARLGGETVLKMIFEDGFVHADLHPANILLTEDDRVVLIDLGMVSEIPADLLRPWVETFVALAQQDGRRVAELLYTYSPNVGRGEYAAFERDVLANLDALHGKRLGEVEISVAVTSMMNVLRRHRVQIDPAFTVVNLALLVAEGLGKQLDPEIDLVPLAQPYLARAMLEAPPGRAPAREVPRR